MKPALVIVGVLLAVVVLGGLAYAADLNPGWGLLALLGFAKRRPAPALDVTPAIERAEEKRKAADGEHGRAQGEGTLAWVNRRFGRRP